MVHPYPVAAGIKFDNNAILYGVTSNISAALTVDNQAFHPFCATSSVSTGPEKLSIVGIFAHKNVVITVVTGDIDITVVIESYCRFASVGAYGQAGFKRFLRSRVNHKGDFVEGADTITICEGDSQQMLTVCKRIKTLP